MIDRFLSRLGDSTQRNLRSFPKSENNCF